MMGWQTGDQSQLNVARPLGKSLRLEIQVSGARSRETQPPISQASTRTTAQRRKNTQTANIVADQKPWTIAT